MREYYLSILLLSFVFNSCSSLDQNTTIDYLKKDGQQYITAKLRSIIPQVRECYSDYITNDKEKDLYLKSIIEISKTGRVEKVELNSKVKLSPRLENCIKYEIYSLSLRPTSRPEGLVISQPYNLRMSK